MAIRNLTDSNPGSDPGDSLGGKSVSEILAAVNVALGGGALPEWYNFATLDDLLNNLNNAADVSKSCTATGWANLHLYQQ